MILTWAILATVAFIIAIAMKQQISTIRDRNIDFFHRQLEHRGKTIADLQEQLTQMSVDCVGEIRTLTSSRDRWKKSSIDTQRKLDNLWAKAEPLQEKSERMTEISILANQALGKVILEINIDGDSAHVKCIEGSMTEIVAEELMEIISKDWESYKSIVDYYVRGHKTLSNAQTWKLSDIVKYCSHEYRDLTLSFRDPGECNPGGASMTLHLTTDDELGQKIWDEMREHAETIDRDKSV